MRKIVFLTIAGLAWIAYLTSALALERHRERMTTTNFTRIDFPVCVRINPGPLVPPKRRVNGRAPVSELV